MQFDSTTNSGRASIIEAYKIAVSRSPLFLPFSFVPSVLLRSLMNRVPSLPGEPCPFTPFLGELCPVLLEMRYSDCENPPFCWKSATAVP